MTQRENARDFLNEKATYPNERVRLEARNHYFALFQELRGLISPSAEMDDIQFIFIQGILNDTADALYAEAGRPADMKASKTDWKMRLLQVATYINSYSSAQR
jgi:hypothetical protein